MSSHGPGHIQPQNQPNGQKQAAETAQQAQADQDEHDEQRDAQPVVPPWLARPGWRLTPRRLCFHPGHPRIR